MDKVIEGTWPENDLRRAFVAGARWWEWHKTELTMWQSDIRRAEAEAEKKYPGGQCAEPDDRKLPRSNSAIITANIFKFRAECIADVEGLKKILGEKAKMAEMVRESPTFLVGAVMEMETTETLDAVKQAMRKVPDGHIMFQTVAPRDEYTSKRRMHEE